MFTVVELISRMIFFLGLLHHVDVGKHTAFIFRVTVAFLLLTEGSKLVR